jgi:hypothetical protein
MNRVRLLRELAKHDQAAEPGPDGTLTLDPFMVEHGDIITGTTAPVASILYSGVTAEWIYAAADRTIIAKVLFNSTVTVRRPERRLGMVRL